MMRHTALRIRNQLVALVLGCVIVLESHNAVAQCSAEMRLHQGWNLVSIPFRPYNSTVKSVLASLIWAHALQSVWSYDAEYVNESGNRGRWLWYAPALDNGDCPSILNKLCTLEPGKGYWLNVSRDTHVDIWGEVAEPTFTIQPGWNLLGLAGLELRTWDMVFAGSVGENGLLSLWGFEGSYANLAPGWQPGWLEPGIGVWAKSAGMLTVPPPSAERVLPWKQDSVGAFLPYGGAGTASSPWPFRFSEYTFDSAGFDIDRAPVGCYGPEDTDAWDREGELVRDESGFPGQDGIIDPPVTTLPPTRFRLSMTIGSPLSGASEGSDSNGNPVILNMGGLGIFMLANRPDVPRPQGSEARIIPKASAAATLEVDKEGGNNP